MNQEIREIIRKAVVAAEDAGRDNDVGIADYVYDALYDEGYVVLKAAGPVVREP